MLPANRSTSRWEGLRGTRGNGPKPVIKARIVFRVTCLTSLIMRRFAGATVERAEHAHPISRNRLDRLSRFPDNSTIGPPGAIAAVAWIDGGHGMAERFALKHFPLHLGLGARAVVEPEFTSMDWYDGYDARHAADGAEGRLVSMYSFDESWESWEMHPAGDEAVICTEGEITLIQEWQGGIRKIPLRAGDYAINPRGVWHTADTDGPATALFITPGLGTEHRGR